MLVLVIYLVVFTYLAAIFDCFAAFSSFCSHYLLILSLKKTLYKVCAFSIDTLGTIINITPWISVKL